MKKEIEVDQTGAELLSVVLGDAAEHCLQAEEHALEMGDYDGADYIRGEAVTLLEARRAIDLIKW